MNKIFFAALFLFAGCANEYRYVKDGEEHTAKPYGWADYQENHDEEVEYRVCIPNVVISVILSETVIVPVWLTGWELFEPIGDEPKTFLP